MSCEGCAKALAIFGLGGRVCALGLGKPRLAHELS